ncbi:MAG: hypothetical protein IPF72_18300 [Chitinophagaceae bacterium]|nr:hypothetical protein [Chitinophagaceae bacterium]
MLTLRRATLLDSELYYQWANDALVRAQSFNTVAIDHDTHTKWFAERINNPDFYFYIFQNESKQMLARCVSQKIKTIRRSLVYPLTVCTGVKVVNSNTKYGIG